MNALRKRSSHLLLLPLVILVIFQLNFSCGSKFKPTVKVRTENLGPVDSSKTSGSGESSSVSRKGKNCADVNCMLQPVHSPGSPECKPRYDGDSCCPTWICASDEHLAKGLFDENNNWNVKHEYDRNMFRDNHHDDDDYFYTSQAPPTDTVEQPQPKPFSTLEKSEKIRKYAAKGKFDNTHNKNFISRMQHDDASIPAPSSLHSPPSSQKKRGHNKGREQSISDSYAVYKRNLQHMAKKQDDETSNNNNKNDPRLHDYNLI